MWSSFWRGEFERSYPRIKPTHIPITVRGQQSRPMHAVNQRFNHKISLTVRYLKEHSNLKSTNCGRSHFIYTAHQHILSPAPSCATVLQWPFLRRSMRVGANIQPVFVQSKWERRSGHWHAYGRESSLANRKTVLGIITFWIHLWTVLRSVTPMDNRAVYWSGPPFAVYLKRRRWCRCSYTKRQTWHWLYRKQGLRRVLREVRR